MRRHHFEVETVRDTDEAFAVIKAAVETERPETVSFGDSMSMRATGVIEWLRGDERYRLLDGFDPAMTYPQRLEIRRQALMSDLFITGVNAVTEQIWDAQRKEIEGVCLLGTISNSDTSFEMNSGYEVDGITQFYMPVDISWQKEEGTIFCPNGEVLASVESGSATAGTNLMYGQDAVLNYDLSGLGEITGIKFFKPEYDDPKYFESFRGQVAFYCWSSGEYETISKWEKLFDGTELEKYLSEDGTLRVRYQVADDMDVTDKNCTLPCLQITGKVVTPDA